MKKYIVPNTTATKIETQQLMAGSPKLDPSSEMDPNGMEAKEFDFVTEGEQAWKNEYPAFSLWED